MHALGTAQLSHQGSGVRGGKSQVLFVNDKAIISLVLHREGGEILQQRFKQGFPRETTELVGWKSFFFFPLRLPLFFHWSKHTNQRGEKKRRKAKLTVFIVCSQAPR